MHYQWRYWSFALSWLRYQCIRIPSNNGYLYGHVSSKRQATGDAIRVIVFLTFFNQHLEFRTEYCSLTHWPLEDLKETLKKYVIIKLILHLRNCPHMNITGPHWWLVKFSSMKAYATVNALSIVPQSLSDKNWEGHAMWDLVHNLLIEV